MVDTNQSPDIITYPEIGGRVEYVVEGFLGVSRPSRLLRSRNKGYTEPSAKMDLDHRHLNVTSRRHLRRTDSAHHQHDQPLENTIRCTAANQYYSRLHGQNKIPTVIKLSVFYFKVDRAKK